MQINLKLDCTLYFGRGCTLSPEYSINEIEPFEWLKEVLETIPDYPANQLHKLIPAKNNRSF